MVGLKQVFIGIKFRPVFKIFQGHEGQGATLSEPLVVHNIPDSGYFKLRRQTLYRELFSRRGVLERSSKEQARL
jgi:hypothetical protein